MLTSSVLLHHIMLVSLPRRPRFSPPRLSSPYSSSSDNPSIPPVLALFVILPVPPSHPSSSSALQ
eukprot:5535728-Pyramimonas_sp.AAC.1